MSFDGITTQRRFAILQRDDFTCAYCGARPGNDRLEVDHIIPRARGGSDHDNNLVTACWKCNNGKRAQLAVPRSICADWTPRRDGYRTWRTWERWSLLWREDGPGDDATSPPDLLLVLDDREFDYVSLSLIGDEHELEYFVDAYPHEGLRDAWRFTETLLARCTR